MKNGILKVLAISTIAFAIGATFLSNNNRDPQPVSAATHVDNYALYTYSGNYYSTIKSDLSEGLHGSLRKALTTLIFPKGWYTYSGSSSGTTGKELQEADEDPLNSSNMILLYTRDSISKRAAGGNVTDWNREHVWPQDLSCGHWGKNQAGTDILHLRPTWSKTNGARGNTKYGDCNKSNLQTYEGMPYAYTNSSYFEPLDSVKGDVARILMYVWTTYYDHYNDSSLLLTKTIQSYDVLLKWHTLDKPDALEGNRNDYVQSSKQQNRNPFVDHPEYAWKIFGSSVSDSSILNACKTTYPDGTTPDIPPSSTSSSSSSSSSSTSSSSSSSSIISSSESSSSESISSSTSSESSSISSSSIESSSSISSSSSSTPISSYEDSSSSEISSNVHSSSSEISSESSIVSSSESMSESSSIESSSITPSSEQQSSSSEPTKKSGGCHGSIIGTISLTGLTALIGLIFVLSKKK